jgi:uncharacterized membrane protein YeaQ/YmgE (transglycosylase-associated protein family)
MPILFLIILGAAAGFIATKVMKVNADLITTIAIGVGGALIGGLILRAVSSLAGVASGLVGAILGAVLILWIWSRLKGRN